MFVPSRSVAATTVLTGTVAPTTVMWWTEKVPARAALSTARETPSRRSVHAIGRIRPGGRGALGSGRGRGRGFMAAGRAECALRRVGGGVVVMALLLL